MTALNAEILDFKYLVIIDLNVHNNAKGCIFNVIYMENVEETSHTPTLKKLTFVSNRKLKSERL